MMRLQIAVVGKLKRGPERELLATYLDRAQASGRAMGFGPFTQAELAEAKLPDADARKAAEADALLSKIPTDSKIVALDPGGRTLSSEAFAERLRDLRDEAVPGVCFVIGGADGLGQPLLERADETLSLGPMVLPHGLARIVLAEQLYRAMTILAGHPYHRG
ncbi:23S rRNA (pseudouridine(1915)-N(3))-methyltransferase RlmH [Methyloligella solikamskensis]|uniref:Ribosomal RNA large subunit methyltransferase H n=1 Tax=Methyloligella solikamskensis TaxID=1177756 RepID=A0ABW3J642_9HYPH